MNIKKLLLTVFIILAFTVIFLLCFHHCARAEEISGEISMEQETEANTSEELTPPQNGQDPSNSEIESSENDVEESEAVKKGKEIGIYIKEKILPVVVGVLTSVSALLATLMAIKRALSSIGEAKDTFKTEAKERDRRFKEESDYLKKKTEDIDKALALVPALQAEITRLEEKTSALVTECTYLGKMISLGFSQSKDVVSSGNGKKINRLLKECKRLSGETDEGDNEE